MSESSSPQKTPKPRIPRIIGISFKLVLVVAITFCVLLMTLWASLALYFCNISGEWFRILLAGVFALGTVAAFALVPNRWRREMIPRIAISNAIVRAVEKLSRQQTLEKMTYEMKSV